MQKLDGKSPTNVVGNYKLDRFTFLNSTISDASIFTNKISATTASGIYKKAIFLPLNSLSEPVQELIWLVNNLEISNGKSIASLINRAIIQTDASQKGWGAYCQKISIGGQWTLQESRLHINLLELKAISLTLLTFHKMLFLKAGHFQVDSTTSLSYLMKMGGTGSREMTALVRESWEFVLSKTECDSRLRVQEFCGFQRIAVVPKMFQIMSRNWGTPEIDLFASRACLQSLPSTSHLYGLETGSLQSGNRRSPTEMEKPWTTICFSPFLTDRKSSFKSQGRGINNAFGNSKLACTTLVKSNPRSVHNRTSTPAPISGTFGRFQGTGTSSSVEQDFKTNGLENFRKNLVEKGISNTAANLISNSRKSGTTANYQSAWKKWVSWCSER